MIVFLFGTWGSGKSYVGNLIQQACGILHMEADIHFDKQMLNALHAKSFHTLDLRNYYERVMSDIFNFQRRTNNFVVSQAIYQERYRDMIFNVFDPDIRFIWVKAEDQAVQKERLNFRAEKYGNPITAEVYDYMLAYWEEPQIPHIQLLNGSNIREDLSSHLQDWGLCADWDF